MKSVHVSIAVSLLFICGCNNDSSANALSSVTIPPPQGRLIFQPTFLFANGETTHQGTGFIIAGRDGELLGVTSSHYLDFDGPQMLQAQWQTIPYGNAAANFKQSLGAPGKASESESLDLRSDYFVLVGELQSATITTLVLDEREHPDNGERVWLPNQNHDSPPGHLYVQGTVAESANEYVYIVLDQEIVLQSQSGSPIISQRTGKVIGTLSGGTTEDGVTSLILCPASAIARLIQSDPPNIALIDALGRASTP